MTIRDSRTEGKVALVLAGGGLTGAVYEIGALRAVNDLLQDRTVNDFDIYVGTSAGALVSAYVASGVSPVTMLQVIGGLHPEIGQIERKDILSLDRGALLHWASRVPAKFLRAASHYARHWDDLTLFDVVWSLSEALPAGLYDSLALEKYMRKTLYDLSRSNRFDDLEKDLSVIATDLDTGERVVFGKAGRTDVPISLAVAASTALPVVYTPVRIGDHEYVDGGLRGTASLDLAIERGAKLIICINPIVPYDNSDHRSIPSLGLEGGYLSEKGLQSVASQVYRTTIHSGLHYHIKQLRRSHPSVDILLIEPRSDDYRMFYSNIMRYSARLIVAEHGFESVTVDLAEAYPCYEEIFAKHGIAISPQLLIEELAEIQGSGYAPEVIRRILDDRRVAGERRRSSAPIRGLRRALNDLDSTLDELYTPQSKAAA